VSRQSLVASGGRGNGVQTERYLEGLTFRVADDNQKVRALELRSHIYAEELGDPGLDDSDTLASHLIAVDDGSSEIVAALRLIGPDHRPFDIEQFVDLSKLLAPERRPAEASRFWVHRGHRAVHRRQLVHLGMLKLLYEYAVQHNITDLIMLGLPDLIKLYRAAFFVAFDVAFVHPIWGSTQVMRFDISEVRRVHQNSRNPVARLLFRTQLSNVLV